MSSVQITLNATNSTANVPQLFYTAPLTGNGVIIDSVTASNTSAVDASYEGYIVNSSEAASNPQRPFKVVVWGANDFGLGMVNQLIPPGGRVFFECSAINSIYFTVTGREV